MLGMILKTLHYSCEKLQHQTFTLPHTSAISSCAHASQVWSPQTITMCMELEQRRATKFVLGLPFKRNTPYKTRLPSPKMLPLCYWHEYLDIPSLCKCAHGFIKTDIAPEQVANQAINLRSTNNTYKISKVRMLCHQNSYMVRVPCTHMEFSPGRASQSKHFLPDFQICCI